MNRVLNIVLLIGLTYWGNAQSLDRQVISAAGEAVENNSAMLSYTFGETITASSIQSTVTLTQGFQQVDTLEFVGIPKLNSSASNLLVYPNPSRDHIFVKIGSINEGRILPLYIQIVNLHGELIKKKTILSEYESIDIKDLLASAYIIKFYDRDGNVLQRVRFIKY